MRNIYKLIFFLFSSLIMAQTPGGVQDITIEYWLKADEVTNTVIQDGDAVSTWIDRSGNARNFTNTTGQKPRFIKSAMNFHSAVEFYQDEAASATDNQRRKLESLTNFQVDQNKSYFVIWVSRLNNDDYTGSSNNATVFNLASTGGDSYGWTAGTGSNANNLLHTTRGTAYRYSYSSNGYGIGIAMIPNKTGSGALRQEQILNGLASTTSMTARTMYTAAQKSVIGNSRDGIATNDSYYGEIMEIIVLSKPSGASGTVLSNLDLKKINTHLSIKYGMALNASQADYILSDGTVIYNSGVARYTSFKSDIFGIARDDASGLYQKQSMSTDNPVLSISLGDFEEINAENTATLPDKNALMFGANGVDGMTTYNHRGGTNFANYTLQTNTDPVTGVIVQERLTSLFKYKLRAKTTGQQAYTLNARAGMGSWIVVSADPSFIPSQTRIYKVKDGVAKDVLIQDGDYVGFALELLAPGGVINGLRMWLNASVRNTITLDSRGEIVNWTDNSGMGTTYRKRPANNAAPLYVESEERANFHPTPLFRKWQDYLITDKAAMSVASPADVAFYGVVNHNFATTRSYFIGFGQQTVGSNGRRPSFGVYRGSGNGMDGFGRIGSTGLTNSPSRLFNAGATTIAGYHWKIGSGVTFEFDGGHSEYVRHTSRNVLMNGPGMLGLGSSSNSYYLQGVMPELILYEGVLTENERVRINSYLGLKYAITIKIGAAGNQNFNYLLSDNTSVWNGNSSATSPFHNNVASVVRDDEADLENTQAKSTDIGAIVHMGVGTKLGTDSQLAEIIRDKSAITWGHNGGSMSQHSFAGNQTICGEMDSRLNGRIWMVDNTNFDQSILVRAADQVFPYNGSNWQVFLLIADSPSKILANSWDQIVPLEYSYGGHQGNYKFPTDKVTYFTFAAKTLPGSCESCDFNGVKRLEFNRSNWPNGATSKTFNLGDGFTADVKVTVEAPSIHSNRYPRASSLRSLREYRRRGSGDKKMVTEVLLKQDGALKAAASTFEIFEIDRMSGRYSNVEVYGVCGQGIIMPKLSYQSRRSSYTIEGNSAIGKTSSSYTSPRGRMYVEFDTPVEKIYVVHTYTGRSGHGNMRIGIGPMEFVCVPPAPVPNEDGLIFTKQGPPALLLCEEATYTFRITNTNCAPYNVDFSDVLPAGMKWVTESLSVDEEAIATAIINEYGKTNTLTIQSLKVPGSSTLTFRAKAIFDLDAQPGTYENRAIIDYSSRENPNEKHQVLSCDRLSSGCEPTRTIATGDPSVRPLPIETKMTSDKACYTEDKELTISLKINNPNAFSLDHAMLEFNYNEEFSYVQNSIQSATIRLNGSVVIDTSELGSIVLEELQLPPGEHRITFKVKAPTLPNINWEDIDPLDPSKGQIESPFYIDCDLIIEVDDVCLNGTTTESNGSLEIEYCTVCYYDPVEGDNGDIFDSKGYLAITTLDRPNKDWIATRGNAFVVLESKTKGFVITRLTTIQIEHLTPVEGMLVYDTTVNCLKMYDGVKWGCLEQGCVDE